MENQVFPYGPSPSRLIALCKALSGSRKVSVDLDRLERVGVPKTQVSIALSGLRQMGFVTPAGEVTDLCRQFSSPSSRPAASERIIRKLYSPLEEVANSDPSEALAACHAYLQRLGRGASAQEKILKLFVFFRLQSGRPVTSGAPEVGDLRGVRAQATGPEMPPADSAALELAVSLRRFCEIRSGVLEEKRTLVRALQAECAQIEAEIDRASQMLEQHLSLYPSLPI